MKTHAVASNALTAHLASVRKVHDAQVSAMRDLGLGDLREQMIRTTVALSDSVASILGKARNVAQAELRARIVELGSVGLEIVQKVPSLAALV